MKLFKYLVIVSILLAILTFSACDLLGLTEPAASSPPSSDLKVTFIDVGQADATLIQSDSSTMLIDAGSNSAANGLVSTLENLGVDRIDVLVGTHPHEDHIGGMDVVIDEFEIGQIFMPDITADTRTFEDVLESIENKGLSITLPVAGSSFTLGSAEWTILAPQSERYSDTNNYSIVIRMVHGENSFIFMGDAHRESEEEILNSGLTLQSDVIKIGHHGSRSSTSVEFLDAVSPEYAVISVGENNTYNHPHEETLETLSQANIQVYRTDLSGDITFISDGVNLTVETER